MRISENPSDPNSIQINAGKVYDLHNNEQAATISIVSSAGRQKPAKETSASETENTIKTVTTLLVFLVIGEVAVNLAGVPIPGGVAGFVFFLLYLIHKGSVPTEIENTVPVLLRHLSLLFVPAGVGVVEYFNQLSTEWTGIAAAIAGSTMLTIVATASVFAIFSRTSPKGDIKCGAGK